MTSKRMLPIAMQNHRRCRHAARRSHTATSQRRLEKQTYVGFQLNSSHPSVAPIIDTTQHTTFVSLQRFKHRPCFIVDVQTTSAYPQWGAGFPPPPRSMADHSSLRCSGYCSLPRQRDFAFAAKHIVCVTSYICFTKTQTNALLNKFFFLFFLTRRDRYRTLVGDCTAGLGTSC